MEERRKKEKEDSERILTGEHYCSAIYAVTLRVTSRLPYLNNKFNELNNVNGEVGWDTMSSWIKNNMLSLIKLNVN